MEEQQAHHEQVKLMSFTEKLTNIFASPGELFENVRLTGPTTGNWLMPLIIFLVVALVMGQIMIHNASLADQLGATIRKGFEKSVQEGKMTQEQADQTYENYAKPGSTMFMISQIGGTIIVTPIVLFLVGLVYWLLGKFAMGATAPYMKVVEVVGLTFLIGTLEYIVTTCMMIGLDSIHGTPSLGAFVSGFDPQNKMHLALSKINIFTFWSLGVTSVGLSKLFQRDLAKVVVLVVALWIVWSVGTIALGMNFGG